MITSNYNLLKKAILESIITTDIITVVTSHNEISINMELCDNYILDINQGKKYYKAENIVKDYLKFFSKNETIYRFF